MTVMTSTTTAMTPDTATPAPDSKPGSEGSDTCVQILLMLNTFIDGLSARELMTYTGHTADAVRQALIGLQRRGRIECLGRGKMSPWRLARKAG
jgi:hypothetical protein